MPPNPLQKIFQIYLEADEKNELEVKFFTRKYEKISIKSINSFVVWSFAL